MTTPADIANLVSGKAQTEDQEQIAAALRALSKSLLLVYGQDFLDAEFIPQGRTFRTVLQEMGQRARQLRAPYAESDVCARALRTINKEMP